MQIKCVPYSCASNVGSFEIYSPNQRGGIIGKRRYVVNSAKINCKQENK